MKGFTCSPPTIIKSINVVHFKADFFDSPDNLIKDFYNSDKGKWIMKNSVGMEKTLTYDTNGDMIITMVVLLPEPKHNFFILKWC